MNAVYSEDRQTRPTKFCWLAVTQKISCFMSVEMRALTHKDTGAVIRYNGNVHLHVDLWAFSRRTTGNRDAT